ncbi:MAG: hypothetical protein D8M59_15675 [Planctomycetes bacterium]|nr:hypothetical protein [Planctomycetota bacterium]
MGGPKGSDRFAAGKALVATAERDATRVYPHFDEIAMLLDSDSKVITWNAMQLIGHMAAVDSSKKVDALLDAYLGRICGGSLITAANAMQGAARIAQARPDLADRIITAVLPVEKTEYEKPECRNVAIGQALEVFRDIGDAAMTRPDVKRFIKRQRANTRPSVAKLAGEMAG